MALGVKYRLRYGDEQLIGWQADILQEGFVGSLTRVKAGGIPVTIEMRDIDDPFTPVCHSEATLTLMSETLGQFDEFKTADVYEYSLQVIRDGTLYWQGTLLTEPFTEAFESAPYEIELKFSDGISELSYERYDVSGGLQSGYTSVIDILVKCFNKLPISRGFREIINLFEDNMDDADTEGLLEQLIIYEPAFWETDNSDDEIKGEPALKVIEGIMYSLKCRIVVSQDIYYIIRIAETKTLGTVKYVDYDSSGTVTGNGTIDLRKNTSVRTQVLPALLAHLSGATIDINKQYQEVEFIYSSKNITTMNNSLVINPDFSGGYEVENTSLLPLHYGRSAAVNTVIGIGPAALHLFYAPGFIVYLVMEDLLLANTKISTPTSALGPIYPNPGYLKYFYTLLGHYTADPELPTRETYFLFPESPADNTVTYKNLLYSTDDHIEITIAGWFDYTYAEPGNPSNAITMVFNKWRLKLGAKYYNQGGAGTSAAWDTNANGRVWYKEWAAWDDITIEWINGDSSKKRHEFSKTIIIANFDDDSTDDLEITWYIPETLRTPGAVVDHISAVRIIFTQMAVRYISDSSTEFSVQKVLGETGSTSLRSLRYKSEVKHGDGPSNFSLMSFRLPISNQKTSVWSTRGNAESIFLYKWDIESVFENLGTYRIIFNGELYGLLEMHNIVNLLQENKILLIKGMRFDTKHNIYELKLHEIGTYTVPDVVYTPQFDLSPSFPSVIPTQDSLSNNPIAAVLGGWEVMDSVTLINTHATYIESSGGISLVAEDYPG